MDREPHGTLGAPLGASPMLLVLLLLGLGAASQVGAALERAETVETYIKLSLGILAFCALPILIRGWRITLALTGVYLFFSGFITHMAEYDNTTRLLKFILMATVIFQFFAERILHNETPWPSDPESRRTGVVILLVVCLACLQVFNPYWSSIQSAVTAGIPSLLSHILPMFLFIVGYHLLTSLKQLQNILHLVIGLITIMAIFSWVQHWFLGFEGMARLSPSIAQALVREHLWLDSFEPVWKPISFAADAGAASYFMALGLLFCAILMGTTSVGLWGYLYLLSSSVLISVAMLLTFVRSSFMVAILGITAIAFLVRSPRVLVLVLVLVACMGWLNHGEGATFLLHRYSRLTRPVEAFTTNRGLQLELVFIGLKNYPLGTGVGRAGPAAYYGAEDEINLVGIPGENYFGAVALELGLPGMALMLWLFVRILWLGVATATRVHSNEIRVYAYGATAVLGVIMISGLSGQMLYTTPANFVFWFTAGLLGSLRPLDQKMREASAAENEQSPAPTTGGLLPTTS